MRNTNTSKIKDDQRGVVTIVIVILIMLLMSLIVLAMSRNAAREQRQTLDRQLNSQAFYAAESGVNNFIKEVNDLPDEGDTCDSSGLTGPLTSGSVIEVTCLLYDKTPDTLIYSNISLGGAKTTPIQTTDPAGITNLDMSFEGKDVGNPDYSGCNGAFGSGGSSVNFPPRTDQLSDSCTAGVLRVDIIRTNNPNRANLLEDTTTLYIVPRESNGFNGHAYVSGQQGRIVRANCSNTSTDQFQQDCKLRINDIGLAQGQRLYLSMRSIYRPNSLEIGSNSGSFTGSQILVDSTGKANDVLKRIKTAVPVSALSNASSPSFSVQSSTDLCKLLQVRPDDTTSSECTL